VRCERTHSLVGHSDVVWCASYSSCCTNIAASCSRDRHVIIWDTERGCELFRLPEMSAEVHSVKFGSESTVMAVAVGDCNVYLLDSKDARQLGVCQGHKGAVYCCRFSAGNQWLATASADRTVGLWNLSSSLDRETPIQNLVDSMSSVSLLDDV
jgi:WD40 repeat protein